MFSFLLFTGPAAVQMVSQNRAPPMQVPVQVPPGQVMQQYDGNITHLILSPPFLPAAPAPGQRGVQQMHAPFVSFSSAIYLLTTIFRAFKENHSLALAVCLSGRLCCSTLLCIF